MTASATDIGAVYEAMTRAIDAAGPEQADLLLAKFALLLAQDAGDTVKVPTLLDQSAAGLPVG